MWNRNVSSITLIVVLIVSMVFSSLPWVIADYTVGHASFPPDLPGDINNDARVNLLDAIILSNAFGSVFGGLNWDPRADVDDNGRVNMLDAIRVANALGAEYSTSTTPVAYSSSFEFNVPNDGDVNVWFYILVRFYVPDGLSNRTFRLTADKSVDDAIRNVKVNAMMVYPYQAGGLFNIELGQLRVGYHLLELE